MLMSTALALCPMLTALGASAPSADVDANAHSAGSLPKELVQRMLGAYVFVGGGSGVLVGTDGLILTNHHVIDWLDDFTVRTADGAAWPAKLLGSDPVGDIALLQIDPAARAAAKRDFAGVELAPASALLPGAEVVAIGNPFALGDYDDVPTLTTGILSSGRIVRGGYTDAVQGDAPVNPGNSGGPLFDHQARLLGINGQIRSLTGFRINSGIGLAVASPQLAAFMPLLLAADGGYVRHTAAPKGLELSPAPEGVMVKAAGTSPLLPGDLLVSVAGRRATSVASALGLFASLPWKEGAAATVAIERGSAHERIEIEVALARTPIPGRPYHGLTFAETEAGTIIDHVDADCPAAFAGLTAGSTLTSVAGKAITTKVSLLRALVACEIGDRVEFTVRDRAGQTKTVTLLFKQHP